MLSNAKASKVSRNARLNVRFFYHELLTMKINIAQEHISQLNISPVAKVVEDWLTTGTIASQEQQLSLEITFPREPEDPRELSEIPEIRLWYIRLDACYPWIAFLLDWKSGEFARYVAMLVPHEFHRTEGIQYNPEALEIFVMHKVFDLNSWLEVQGISSKARIQAMAKMLGYELEDDFFNFINLR